MSDTAVAVELDESRYSLTADESAFLKSQTGIEDDDELKEHVLAVQAKAYKIHPYPCIRRFSFTKLTISRLPAYRQVMQLRRERHGVILLDIGCGFGNAARKAVADGFPAQNVIASDLRPEFWELGHELFKSTPESFPATFVAGDALDPSHLASSSPLYEPPQTQVPSLPSLTSLNPLRGHISVIYAALFFHAFNEEKQQQLAQALASLLSPLPGSVIFGGHIGNVEKGDITGARGNMFCHSPRSWRELWDGNVFKKGAVVVEVGLKDIDASFYYLFWSVTRV